MAQHVVFPDPKDRSLNHPMVLVNMNEFLGLYYQQNQKAQTLSNSDQDTLLLKQWFTKAAVMEGWSAIGFMGKDAVLSILPIPEWIANYQDTPEQIATTQVEDHPASAEISATVDAAIAEAATIEASKSVSTTMPGKAATSGCASRLHVSVEEVANGYGPKISHDYKRG